MSSTAVAEGGKSQAADRERNEKPSWRSHWVARVALPVDLPAGNGGRDRPGRPPLLAGLDLRLDRRPDARPLDRRRAAHGQAPDQGLAADHRRAARLRPAQGRGRRQPLRDPLGRARSRGQDPRAREGADGSPAGCALHPGPPALLGLRRVLVLVLALLRHPAGRRRDLALSLPVVPPLRRLHRRPCGAGPRHLRRLPGGAALARRPTTATSTSPTGSTMRW